MLLIGIVAALLPVNYSVGLIDTFSTIIRWIIYAVVQVAFLVLFLLSYVVGLILRLFGNQSQSGEQPEMQRATPPTPPPSAEAMGPPSWWALVRSLIFWGVLALLVGYSIYHFARDRWGLFQGLSTSRFLRWLTGVLHGFWAGHAYTPCAPWSKRSSKRIAARRARAARRPWFFCLAAPPLPARPGALFLRLHLAPQRRPGLWPPSLDDAPGVRGDPAQNHARGGQVRWMA